MSAQKLNCPRSAGFKEFNFSESILTPELYVSLALEVWGAWPSYLRYSCYQKKGRILITPAMFDSDAISSGEAGECEVDCAEYSPCT